MRRQAGPTANLMTTLAISMSTEVPMSGYTEVPWLGYVAFFFGGLMVSALITWWIVRCKRRWGNDQPDGVRKLHEAPVPRIGGIGVFAAFVLGVALLGWFAGFQFVKDWWPVWLCNLLMFGVGFLDDLRPMGARVKLFGQIGVAVVAFSLGLSIDKFSAFTGDGTFYLGTLSIVVTMIWLVAIPNVVNLIDGMDGLASGLGMFLCLTLAFVGYMAGLGGVALISLAVGGALLGFLIFNLPPAKVFLGDGGAYFIGFFIASVSMATSNKGAIIASMLVVVIALGLPILDTLFAILRRGITGVPVFRGDAEHIHHRLITLGYSKNMALITLYGICLVLSVVGIAMFLKRDIMMIPIIGTAAVLLALGAARYLGYVKSWRHARRQLRAALARRAEVQYAVNHSQLLEVEIERCQSSQEFWALFDHSLRRLGLRLRPLPGDQRLDLPLPDGTNWQLFHERDRRSHDDWKALASCLVQPYVLGAERWGSPLGHSVAHAARHSERQQLPPKDSLTSGSAA